MSAVTEVLAVRYRGMAVAAAMAVTRILRTPLSVVTVVSEAMRPLGLVG